MKKLTDLLKSLLAKGFATEVEKAKVARLYKALDGEQQEAVEEDVDKVNDLPESGDDAPADDEEDVEEEIQKGIKSLLTKATGELKAEVKEWLQSQGEIMAKKAGIYHPEVQKSHKRLSDAIRATVKAVKSGDSSYLEEFTGLSKKELTTDATGSPYGGYAVDSELSAEIRHLMTEYGVARREMTAIQLSKHSYKANELTTDVTVYWVDEGSAIGSTQVVLGQETLELKKLGAIVTLTSELIADEEIDLFAFIASRVAEGFARAEDLAFFDGDGTSTYGNFTGLLRATDVNEVTMAGSTFASIDADDLIDMADATPQGALTNAKYYMHRTIMSFIRKLKTANTNEYIYQAPSQSGPATIWGYPVVLVEAMPAKSATAADKSFVLFGDLKKACIFGYKGAIVADRFNAGVIRNVANNADINLITTDREAIRWVTRVGYIRILPTAVTKLTTAEVSA